MVTFEPFLSTAVQHERGPRNSTIRRQVAMYLKETSELGTVLAPHPFRSPFLPAAYLPFEHVNDGITVSAVETVTSPTAVAAATSASPPANGIIAQPLPKVSAVDSVAAIYHRPELPQVSFL